MNEIWDTLTSEEEKQLRLFYSDWRNAEEATEVALRPFAEFSLNWCYTEAGLSPPKILWCTSPLAMILARTALIVLHQHRTGSFPRLEDDTRYLDYNASVLGEPLRHKLRDEPFRNCSKQISEAITDSFRYKLWVNLSDSMSFSPLFKFDLYIDQSKVERGAASPLEKQRIRIVNTIWISAVFAINASVIAKSGSSISDSVWNSVWSCIEMEFGPVSQELKLELQDSIFSLPEFRKTMADVLNQVAFGQHDARLLVVPSFLRSVCKLEAETHALRGQLGLALSSGWWLPHTNICWLTERHNKLSLDVFGRPHHESGPAIAFLDDWRIYCWHGVVVSEKIIERPHEITMEEIDNEPNTELKRIMIERFGAERYLQAAGMELVDNDPEFGTLYRKTVSPQDIIVMVRVINSTPEPDGTHKEYFLRVPPNMTKAREAVAWTFNMDAVNYRPEKET